MPAEALLIPGPSRRALCVWLLALLAGPAHGAPPPVRTVLKINDSTIVIPDPKGLNPEAPDLVEWMTSNTKRYLQWFAGDGDTNFVVRAVWYLETRLPAAGGKGILTRFPAAYVVSPIAPVSPVRGYNLMAMDQKSASLLRASDPQFEEAARAARAILAGDPRGKWARPIEVPAGARLGLERVHLPDSASGRIAVGRFPDRGGATLPLLAGQATVVAHGQVFTMFMVGMAPPTTATVAALRRDFTRWLRATVAEPIPRVAKPARH
jgi:hypothetical protein